MKKGIFTLIGLVVLNWSTAQTVAFSDDFQQGNLNNWTIVINDSYTLDTSMSEYAAGWITVADPLNTTDTVASASSFFTEDAFASRWLITPAINLGTYGNFITWSARSGDPSFPDAYKVKISSTGNALADFDKTLMNVVLENEEWTDRSINLSDSGYHDQTVYLAFELTSYNKFVLYLNDVSVTINDPVGIVEPSWITLKTYPNPIIDQVTIQTKASVQWVEVRDLYGKTVAHFENQKTFDLSFLPAGSYWLKAVDADGLNYQQKVVKL